MSSYIHIENALTELSCLLSPHNNEEDKDDWWVCSVYLNVRNFNFVFHYEKCPPDKDGKCWVTDICDLEFSIEDITAKLKAHGLYELENPKIQRVKDD